MKRIVLLLAGLCILAGSLPLWSAKVGFPMHPMLGWMPLAGVFAAGILVALVVRR